MVFSRSGLWFFPVWGFCVSIGLVRLSNTRFRVQGLGGSASPSGYLGISSHSGVFWCLSLSSINSRGYSNTSLLRHSPFSL